jgi:hypothetical protein
MEILSGAISLFAVFLGAIICIPLILLLAIFIYLRNFNKRNGNMFTEIWKIIQNLLNPKKPFSIKKKTPKNVQKAQNIEDAEFREIKT